jgi:hypothetical protein
MPRTQPRTDAAYIAWARNIDSQCTAHQTDWHPDSGQVMQLNTLFANADAAYPANLNPETSSRRTAANKRIAFVQLRRFFGLYVNVLVANTHISEEELAGMGLPSREHHFHMPIPPPHEMPDLVAIVGQHHDVDLYASLPQHGHPSEHVTKTEYHGLVVRYRKEDGRDVWHEEISTRLHITLLFDEEDRGKYVTVTAAWINPRIQHGPWSDEIRVLIN